MMNLPRSVCIYLINLSIFSGIWLVSSLGLISTFPDMAWSQTQNRAHKVEDKYNPNYLNQLIGQIKSTNSANRQPLAKMGVSNQQASEKQSDQSRSPFFSSSAVSASDERGVKAKLHLIVAGLPRDHLAVQLEHFFELSNKKHVVLGNLYIVEERTSSIDSYEFLSDSKVAEKMKQAPLNDFGQWNFNLIQVSKPPGVIHLERSPSWLIDTGKSEFRIYEGRESILQEFSKDGLFIGHLREGNLVSHQRGTQGISFVKALSSARRSNLALSSAVMSKKEWYSSIITSDRAVRAKVLQELDPSSWEEEQIKLAALSTCQSSARKTIPLPNTFSKESKAIDFVYFNPNDDIQAKKAQTLSPKIAIPYTPGLYYDYTPAMSDSDLSRRSTKGKSLEQSNKSSDPRLLLAHFSPVNCLPSRLHFTQHNDLGFLEISEGEIAWAPANQTKIE